MRGSPAWLPRLRRVKLESTGKGLAFEVVFCGYTEVIFAGLVQIELELPEKPLATHWNPHGEHQSVAERAVEV